MILPRIKYFADRDYAGLGEGGREYLRAKRNELAQDLIGARKTGNPTSNVYGLAGKERFRKEAEYIDKDLKSIVPRVKKSAKDRIRWAVGDEKFARDWNNRKASYVKPESIVKPKVVKEAQNKGREELVKTLRAKKALGRNLKKAGYVGLGVAGAAGLAVGAKKLYDRNKQQKEFARADYKGLGETGKQLFRNFRNNLAKQLNGERNQINSRLAEKVKRGSSSLGEFKDLANQKREILQRQVRSNSRYVKNAYKDMGL